jgi:Mrp family chromosome partitioning ATPase
MIIFDAPPMASVTDPIILSQNSDATIIVSWTGKVTYDMLNKGLKQLETASAPVAGIVLNRFSARKTGYYYNYGDYYYSSDA